MHTDVLPSSSIILRRYTLVLLTHSAPWIIGAILHRGHGGVECTKRPARRAHPWRRRALPEVRRCYSCFRRDDNDRDEGTNHLPTIPLSCPVLALALGLDPRLAGPNTDDDGVLLVRETNAAKVSIPQSTIVGYARQVDLVGAWSIQDTRDIAGLANLRQASNRRLQHKRQNLEVVCRFF